jgi:hypothetical protein
MKKNELLQDKIEIEFKGTLKGLKLTSKFTLELNEPIPLLSDDFRVHQQNIMELVNKIYIN